MKLVKGVQRRTTKLVTCIGNGHEEKRLRELGLMRLYTFELDIALLRFSR